MAMSSRRLDAAAGKRYGKKQCYGNGDGHLRMTNVAESSQLYASEPEQEPALVDCAFYQTIEIPGLGVQQGIWDLRPGISHYLGDVDFKGKRVLEVGTANGFVCFEMERRGADVVAFDLAHELTYDAPPLPDAYLNREAYLVGQRRIRNAYWLAHRRLHSKATVAYGHVNHLPPGLGHFDIGVIANVLQHLQDPVGALMQLANFCDTMVVTETDWLRGMYDDLRGLIYYGVDNPYSWYQVKPPLVEAILTRMGFKRFVRTDHTQIMLENVEHDPKLGGIGRKLQVEPVHFTIVAYR
jgi:SAM-dependent methyltransferase